MTAASHAASYDVVLNLSLTSNGGLKRPRKSFVSSLQDVAGAGREMG